MNTQPSCAPPATGAFEFPIHAPNLATALIAATAEANAAQAAPAAPDPAPSPEPPKPTQAFRRDTSGKKLLGRK